MDHSHGRPQLRLPGFDYSQCGAYFLTVCTVDRACLFGDVQDGVMVLNDVGRMVEAEWLRSSAIRGEIRLAEYVIMPNHLHGIVFFEPAGDAVAVDANGSLPPERYRSPRPPRSLSSFVAGWKSVTTRRYNALCGTRGLKLWHDNFFERIVRSEKAYAAIAQYVLDNPVNWSLDPDNMHHHPGKASPE